MKVSIIVPVYNVEQYLEKCINSIINQTYKNIEIILVDDGSTDNSGKICDEYSKKNSRIKVIHKKNGGLSDARNVGIENSTGEYLSFIDSDDYIDSDMIDCLYKGCLNNNCDIAACGKYIEYDNGQYRLKNTLKKMLKFNKCDVFKNILLNTLIDVSACDKLYKKSLFNDIRFPIGKYFEDMGTIYKIIDKSNFLWHIGISKYHYMQRGKSITRSRFDNRYSDMYNFKNDFLNLILTKYRDLNKYTLAFELQILLTIITDYEQSLDPTKNKYNLIVAESKNLLKKKKFKYIFNKNIVLLKKIMLILILLGQTKLVIKIRKMR